MMAGPGDEDAGGGPARHIPVLLGPVLDALKPSSGKLILDGTFGAGGYATAMLERGADVVAVDQDPDAIAAGQALVERFEGRLRLQHGRFSRLDAYVDDLLDGVVLDVGVSSMQLDQAERGFSFRFEGPLDMRMGQVGPSAADVVNSHKVADLTRIFGLLGEERHAGRIARAIESAALTGPSRQRLNLRALSKRRSDASRETRSIRRRACFRACASM